MEDQIAGRKILLYVLVLANFSYCKSQVHIQPIDVQN